MGAVEEFLEGWAQMCVLTGPGMLDGALGAEGIHP